MLSLKSKTFYTVLNWYILVFTLRKSYTDGPSFEFALFQLIFYIAYHESFAFVLF